MFIVWRVMNSYPEKVCEGESGTVPASRDVKSFLIQLRIIVKIMLIVENKNKSNFDDGTMQKRCFIT